MVHVFCLGPISLERGPDAFAGFAIVKGRLQQPIFAPSEERVLADVLRRHPSGPHYCAPELEVVGGELGFEARALPPELLEMRAGLAVNFARGGTLAPSVSPPIVLELLAASAAFFAARAWDAVDSNTLLLARIEGVFTATWEASLLGSGGQEYGIGLYLDRGTHAKMHAARTPEAAAQVRKGLSTIAVTFDPEPAFAAEAIGALTGMPFVPVALFVDKGRMRPVEGKHLVVLAACLRAAASSDGIAEVRVAKSRARVTLTTEGA